MFNDSYLMELSRLNYDLGEFRKEKEVFLVEFEFFYVIKKDFNVLLESNWRFNKELRDFEVNLEI